MDLKRELEPGKKANTDLAQDIAAFAIHGGLVLIGVTEGPPVELNSVPLQGLPERIEQIARMKVDEGLAVTATPIPARDDPTVGYVAIHVPRSPRAPHMVDGRYYARGNKTNIVLSDQEVLRFHERRFARRDDLIAEARRILTAAGPEHNSLVVMVADPVASYADFLEGLSADADWATQARQLVTTATTRRTTDTLHPSLILRKLLSGDPVASRLRLAWIATIASKVAIGPPRWCSTSPDDLHSFPNVRPSYGAFPTSTRRHPTRKWCWRN